MNTSDSVANSACHVATPTLVYAKPGSKAEFDQIALPETVFDWETSLDLSLIRSDGRTWERRVRSKKMRAGRLMVVFQWFEERPCTFESGGGSAREGGDGA